MMHIVTYWRHVERACGILVENGPSTTLKALLSAAVSESETCCASMFFLIMWRIMRNHSVLIPLTKNSNQVQSLNYIPTSETGNRVAQNITIKRSYKMENTLKGLIGNRQCPALNDRCLSVGLTLGSNPVS